MRVRMMAYSLPKRQLEWQLQRGRELLKEMQARRSCRHFSDKPVPRELIQLALEIAHTAPSGANRKPWRFVAINDRIMKREIRQAAEAEERKSYGGRSPGASLGALSPLGAGPEKPYLENAPWLVVLFRADWEIVAGEKRKNYFPAESLGIMSGFFFMACHMLGLATLPHAPSPIKLLRDICRRPENEKPVLLIPVGYPGRDAVVPDIPKKALREALQWNR